MRIFCNAKNSYIFPAKNNSVFVIFVFEILTKSFNDVVNFEQLAPGVDVNYGAVFTFCVTR